MTVLLPVTDDAETAGFFAAAARHQLGVLFCTTCDRPLHLPRPYCYHCGAFTTEWRDVDGAATVYAASVVTQALIPGTEVPYTLVVVELDAHRTVRFVSSLPGAHQLETGAAMVVTFDDVGGGTTLPRWVPA